MLSEKLKYCSIEKFSGYKPKLQKGMVIKRNNYTVITGFSITGDAPKEFIRVYEYGTGRKCNFRTWSMYIAKTGHKWYPIESITEHLLNCFGCSLGLNMSFSRLALAGGQIRFLSKYFLKKEQELVHGADIYAGFLNDRGFVEEIEEKQLARDFFTIQFTEQAIRSIFPEQTDTILHEFVKMLIFDALVGNNDRHFYNWAIIRHIHCLHEPKFSPIYDTARGLFWNESEQKIVSLHRNKGNLKAFLQKYTENSRPKIGWEGELNINHYKLVQLIAQNEFYISKIQIKELLSQPKLEKLFYVLDTEFKGLLSKERTDLIRLCLEYRHKRLLELID
jgi:hypothetical protein